MSLVVLLKYVLPFDVSICLLGSVNFFVGPVQGSGAVIQDEVQ